MASSSTDVSQIEQALSSIRDGLGDKTAVKKAATPLASYKAEVVLAILVPSLFAGDGTLSTSEALLVLQGLVELDSNRYLQPASLAVRDEVARRSSSTDALDISDHLLALMVAQLASGDVQVSQNATQALVACCRRLGMPFGEQVLQAIGRSWRQAWNGSKETSTIAVRCASAMVDLVCLNDAMMRAAIECKDINILLSMLVDESDPLLEMSCLDLIERMIVTEPMHAERAQWLFSTNVLVPILQMAGGTEQGYADPILGGTALRVAAALCKLIHKDASLLSSAGADLLTGFHRALHNFEVSSETDRLAIIDAISSFASASEEALERVLDDPVTREAWLLLKVAQPRLKSAILYSVALVLNPPNDKTDSSGDMVPSPPPSNVSGIKLFSSLGRVNDEDPTALVLGFAKSPLPELRLGAYALLLAVARLPTGGQLMFAYPGFFEFLMEREAEKTKEGREAKYEIVQTIVGSQVKGLLADEIVRKLEKYVKDGPHYVKGISWELATE